jgi:hypothetical protein
MVSNDIIKGIPTQPIVTRFSWIVEVFREPIAGDLQLSESPDPKRLCFMLRGTSGRPGSQAGSVGTENFPSTQVG